MTQGFDSTLLDAQAMPVEPVEPEAFDLERFEAYAAEADRRYAAFLQRRQGLAVWQRVRVGEVFRDACRDKRTSLRLQLGGLTQSLAYATDAPMYLEPWYGIGTTASIFGAEYEWPPGQAPVVRPLYHSIDEVPPLRPQPYDQIAILRETLDTVEYFLEATRGRVPLSWSDLQSPLNVAAELVGTGEFLLGMMDEPARAQEILAAITDQVIAFTQRQSALIGSRLARPGHGFASSRAGTGIGLSTDILIMISPRQYERFCLGGLARIGSAFGGLALHSCGDWSRWLRAVCGTPTLTMVDAAFGPQTDPNPCPPEVFRDALVDTGIILHARVVGPPHLVLDVARQLWTPGLRLILVTYVREPEAQRRLYQDLHTLVG